MIAKRIGKQTVKLENPPSIICTGSTVSQKEGIGPLGRYFDTIVEDELWGEQSWEKAESKFIKETFSKIIGKSGKAVGEVNYIIAGDLLNQCIGTSFGLRESGASFLGVYGACSTMGESMSIGSMLIDGGFADNVVCMTSSHFCSAEKQFRFPLELGSQRSPTAQWTVTGCGGVFISKEGTGPFITHVTTGKIVDMGIKDSNNMGAAMAPAAVDTIVTHFNDTGFDMNKYDLIITGDLGKIGRNICDDMLKQNDINISDKYTDCGVLIYDMERQDAHSGGSGCGCSAVTLAGYIYSEMMNGNLKNILFVATGALLNSTSTMQGESIPGIAHAISISNTR